MVTVGPDTRERRKSRLVNQGQDDRYMRLWGRNISLPAVSRSCDCHVFAREGGGTPYNLPIRGGSARKLKEYLFEASGRDFTS